MIKKPLNSSDNTSKTQWTKSNWQTSWKEKDKEDYNASRVDRKANTIWGYWSNMPNKIATSFWESWHYREIDTCSEQCLLSAAARTQSSSWANWKRSQIFTEQRKICNRSNLADIMSYIQIQRWKYFQKTIKEINPLPFSTNLLNTTVSND